MDYRNGPTIEELKRKLKYDPETGEFAWLTGRIAKVVGHKHEQGYIRIALNGKRYYAHRLAWLYVYEEWYDGQLDHIDHNPSNNRISNLRKSGPELNAYNRVKQPYGVYWDKERARWRAGNVAGRFVGRFETVSEARAARNAAVEKHLKVLNERASRNKKTGELD